MNEYLVFFIDNYLKVEINKEMYHGVFEIPFVPFPLNLFYLKYKCLFRNKNNYLFNNQYLDINILNIIVKI